MQPQGLRIQYSLQAFMRRDDDAGVEVVWCPALDVRTQGADEDEAREALQSAATYYIQHCYERGILDEQLRSRGFVPIPKTSSVHVGSDMPMQSIRVEPVYDKEFSIDVPLELVQTRSGKGGAAECLQS